VEAKISAELAGQEVSGWLDFKSVKPTKRVTHGQYINTLVEGVMYGDLVINKDFSITHKLNAPIGLDGSIKELTYKPRLTAAQMNTCLKSVVYGDSDVASTIAVGAGLSDENSGIIANMFTEDLTTLAAVAVFFT
jgi:hypothetical protein